MRALVVAVVAFAAMEPLTAATHRFVMHGVGMALHRSHHRRTHRGWEANDAYPVMFAAVVCLGLWIGFHEPRLADLVPIGVGITAYGAAYAAVHDVYIHRRLRWFGDRRPAVLERLADRPRAAPPLRRGALRDAGADRAAARQGQGVSRRAGHGRPTSLTHRRARSGRTAPRRTTALLASVARPRRGAAIGRTPSPRRRRATR